MTHCPHCHQETIRQVGQSIDCTNPNCDGYTVTLPPEQFMALTAKDFSAYKAGQYDQHEMNIAQDEFEARMIQLKRDAAARAAARKPTDQLFG